jgi:hypothetical protein
MIRQSEGAKTRLKSKARTKLKNSSIPDLSSEGSQLVKDAAALLDEEVAAGIVAAKQMQQRFREERRIDPEDFKGALKKFQSDAHQIVSSLNDQFGDLSSQQNAALMKRLVGNTHDVLDLAVELVNIGSEIADQLAQTNLKGAPRRNGKVGK